MRLNPLIVCLVLSFLQCQSARKREFVYTSTTSPVHSQITLGLVGDIMQHNSQISTAQSLKSTAYSNTFVYIKPELDSVDIAVANLEGVFGGKPYTGYPDFSMPDALLPAMKKAGFDVLTTSNNHCLDRGRRGIRRTIHLLDEIGMKHLGTYDNLCERKQNYPLIIRRKGFVIALLNYTYGCNGKIKAPPIINYSDKRIMANDIEKARQLHPDAIIACMHWGNEFQQQPSKEQRSLAAWLINKGVDHVIGTHPHIVQPIEVVTDKAGNKHVVAYSLGNFLSAMSGRGSGGGLLLKIGLVKQDNGKASLQFCTYTPVWVSKKMPSQKDNYVIHTPDSKKMLPMEQRKQMENYLEKVKTLLGKSSEEVTESYSKGPFLKKKQKKVSHVLRK